MRQRPTPQTVRLIHDRRVVLIEEHFVRELATRTTGRKATMANEAHLLQLRQGVAAWNAWRKAYPDLAPDLTDAQLEGADLRGVNFSHTNLARANLEGAILIEANLQGAHLAWTHLRAANLQYANLTGATGLLAGQLGGADTAGAQLPEDIRKFEELATVEQLSQGLQSLFFVLLSACVYSILTIATTTHARLLTNATSSPLPIIGTVIPIASFYMAAPLLLLGLYMYLHLYYLHPLWGILAALPVRFPDGRTLDQKASLWVLTGLDRSPLVHQQSGPRRLVVEPGRMSGLCAWGIVPVTLFLFWLEYLPRHDPWGSLLHSILLVIAMVDSLRLYWFAITPLRGAAPHLSLRGRVALAAAATLSLGLLGVLSFGAMYGFPPSLASTLSTEELARPLATAYLEDENISTKPPNWAVRQEKDEDMAKAIEAVQGAQLEERNLRGANARRAFLAKANLQGADLRDADLFMVQLQGANLTGAQLQQANLSWAWLQRADLSNAHLEGANLQGAFLSASTKLSQAHLEGANLQGAHLQGVNLQGAYLQGADLRGAHLEGANLQGAALEHANLSYAQLQDANLSGAHLEDTVLTGAVLRGSELSETQRQGAIGHGSGLQSKSSTNTKGEEPRIEHPLPESGWDTDSPQLSILREDLRVLGLSWSSKERQSHQSSTPDAPISPLSPLWFSSAPSYS